MYFREIFIYVLRLVKRLMGLSSQPTCSFIVISCSICSIWSTVDASVSKLWITMLAGSRLGFHRGGLLGIGFKDSDMYATNWQKRDA